MFFFSQVGAPAHFIKYPLISHKYSDFVLWSKVVELMSTKQHLTPIGFKTILSYYASINTGLSPKIALAYPNVVPADKYAPRELICPLQRVLQIYIQNGFLRSVL